MPEAHRQQTYLHLKLQTYGFPLKIPMPAFPPQLEALPNYPMALVLNPVASIFPASMTQLSVLRSVFDAPLLSTAIFLFFFPLVNPASSSASRTA